MADKDDFVMKITKKQLFGEAEGRRSVNSPMRAGSPVRRVAPEPRRAVPRGGRRIGDVNAPRQVERDLRAAATSNSIGAAERSTIVSAPVRRRATGALAKKATGSLAGRLAKRVLLPLAGAAAAYGIAKEAKALGGMYSADASSFKGVPKVN